MTLDYGKKPSTFIALASTVETKQQINISQLNAPISLYMMNTIKIVSPKPGNSLRMMDLLIQ